MPQGPGADAKAAGHQDLVGALNHALTSDTALIKLFQRANDDLAHHKVAGASRFACGTCSYVTVNVEFDNCPPCRGPTDGSREVM